MQSFSSFVRYLYALRLALFVSLSFLFLFSLAEFFLFLVSILIPFFEHFAIIYIFQRYFVIFLRGLPVLFQILFFVFFPARSFGIACLGSACGMNVH